MDREEIEKQIIKEKNTNLLLELPTGYGKSKLTISYLKNNTADSSKILIVIPKLCLIDNWKEEFKKWNAESLLNNVTFVTYVSLPKKADVWDIVVYDEVHHLTERCKDALTSFKIKNSIFLSATINREMKFYLTNSVPNLKIYNVKIKDAIDKNVLPDPTVYLIPLTLDNKIASETYIKNKGKGQKIVVPYSKKFYYTNVKQEVDIICTQLQYYNEISSLIEWYKNKISNPYCKNVYLQKCGERLKWLSEKKNSFIKTIYPYIRKEKNITFCNNIEQAKELGKNCINSKDKDSFEILEKFNNGKATKLTCINMLNEGINLNNCRIGIYANLNSSDLIIKQRLGRILRHENPIIIIPYFKNTRDEEIVKKMCIDYNPKLIKIIDNVQQIEL